MFARGKQSSNGATTYTPTLTHPNPFRVDDLVLVNLSSLHIIFFPQPDDFSPDLNKA